MKERRREGEKERRREGEKERRREKERERNRQTANANTKFIETLLTSGTLGCDNTHPITTIRRK